MSGILTPGYLRWDGTKYVLDNDIEIVGPPGSAGPTGPVGPAGPPGPFGVASGDILGTYPGPMSVVGLTGILGIVNFGGGISNPTIGQASTGGTTGQPLTFKAQAASLFGGNVVLQSGTGTTAGLVQFLVGSNLAAYFDSNSIFRYGPNSTSTVTGPNGISPISGTDYIYGNNSAGSIFNEAFCGAATQRALAGVYNTSSAGVNVNGMSLQAPGTSYSVASYAGQGVIEQSGTSTSALVFGKVLGNGTSRGVTGRIFQSGAWGIGDAGTNSTSTVAQAGLSGPVINIGRISSGSHTSTSEQTIIFNTVTPYVSPFPPFGSLTLQGNQAVTMFVGTNLVAGTNSDKFITSRGRRLKLATVGTAGSAVPSSYNVLVSDEIVCVNTSDFDFPNQPNIAQFTINLPASPVTGDTYTIKDVLGFAGYNNIIINGNGKTIDGGFSSITVMTNFTDAVFVYNGTNWISSLTNNVAPNAGYTSVVNATDLIPGNVTGFDQLIVCNTQPGPVVITAPATPEPNMRFTVKDATGFANVNNISVAGNGRTLENPASIGTYTSPITIATAGKSVTWAYDPIRDRYTLVASIG